MLGVYAGCAAEDAAGLAEVVAARCRKLAESVDDAELARAKAQLKAVTVHGPRSRSPPAPSRPPRQLLVFGRLLDHRGDRRGDRRGDAGRPRRRVRAERAGSRRASAPPAVLGPAPRAAPPPRPFHAGDVRLEPKHRLHNRDSDIGRRARESSPWLCWTGFRPTTTCASRATGVRLRPPPQRRFRRVGGAALALARLPAALGADLAGRRPDPRRLAPAAVGLRPRHGARPRLSVPGVPPERRRHGRRHHALQHPPRRRPDGARSATGSASRSRARATRWRRCGR